MFLSIGLILSRLEFAHQASRRPEARNTASGFGHVGGTYANDTFPAYFIVDNLAIGLTSSAARSKPESKSSWRSARPAKDDIARVTLPPGRGSQHAEALSRAR
jgi:hypothetical protein